MLFDQWNEADLGDTAGYGGLDPAAPSGLTGYGPMDTTQDSLLEGDEDDGSQPMFTYLRLQWEPDVPLQGEVVAIDIGNNMLVIGTERCHVIKWNMETNEFMPSRTSSRSEDRLHKVFIDPHGHHVLISLTNGQLFYWGNGQESPRRLSKNKDKFVVQSVAWDKYNSSAKTTSHILLGTTEGLIYELLIVDGKEKVCKNLWTLPLESPMPVSGLILEQFPGEPNKFFVMAATPPRLFEFIGGPTFSDMFARQESNINFVQVPELDYSEVRTFGPDLRARVESFAWLTKPGIYHGALVFGSQEHPGDRVADDCQFLNFPLDDDAGPPPGLGGAAGAVDMANPGEPPVSFVQTEFHFLLLYPTRLLAINKLSQEVVYEEAFPDGSLGLMRGLTRDPAARTVWMFSEHAVFEVVVEDEDRDMWLLLLNSGKYQEAFSYCRDEAQCEQVRTAEANHYFKLGSFEAAARTYAQTQRPFEEVTLKFINKKARNALKTYLREKLAYLRPPPDDATQRVVICTWLTEIFLDKLNRLRGDGLDRVVLPSGGTVLSAAAEAGGGAVDVSELELDSGEDAEMDEDEDYDDVLAEFYDFLREHQQSLSRVTTEELIQSHGRVEDLLFYAELIGNYEWMVDHFLQEEDYESALDQLRMHAEPKEIDQLYYKFCPALMEHVPGECVGMLIEKLDVLEPHRLIPALMRYEATLTQEPEVNHAIVFLERCVKHPSRPNTDPAVHNYLVSLYVKASDEGPLLDFIKTQNQKTGGKPHYDYKYALRLAHQENKKEACVAIYRFMGMFEEAVKLALTFDLELAKEVIRSARYLGEVERKRLWLIVAEHVIDENDGIAKAMEILKDTDLKIEDILPHFPDFVRIREFKDEIRESLHNYNQQIEDLKDEMQAFTASADRIRTEIGQLNNRSMTVSSTKLCDICSQPVLTREFYLFPCTHVFHVDCVTREVRTYLEKNPRVRKEYLREADPRIVLGSEPTKPKASKLPSLDMLEDALGGDSASDAGNGSGDEEALKILQQDDRMREIAGAECIFCGRMMIDQVQTPFIDLPTEEDEARSWAI